MRRQSLQSRILTAWDFTERLKKLTGENDLLNKVEAEFSEMEKRKMTATARHLATAVKVFANSGQAEVAEAWLKEKCKSGLQPNQYAYNKLIDAYSKKRVIPAGA